MRAVIEERNDLCEQWKASEQAHQALRAELAKVDVDRDTCVTQAEELRLQCGQLTGMLQQLQEERSALLTGRQVRDCACIAFYRTFCLQFGPFRPFPVVHSVCSSHKCTCISSASSIKHPPCLQREAERAQQAEGTATQQLEGRVAELAAELDRVREENRALKLQCSTLQGRAMSLTMSLPGAGAGAVPPAPRRLSRLGGAWGTTLRSW
jgi:hypothetical protein